MRISSLMHPGGREYELRDVAALSRADQRRLVALAPKAARAIRSRRHEVAKVSRTLDDAVRLLLPDLEPDVLKRLDWNERVQILWLAVSS